MFGLFRRKQSVAQPRPKTNKTSSLFDDDFQKKLESLALISRRVFAGRQRAERRTRKRGSGIEFADHRNYSPGDDFRFIDWAAYRRFGKLLVRLFEEEEDLSIYLLVDCSGSMGFADGRKFSQARRLAAALAYIGLANLDRVSVVAVGSEVSGRLPPVRGKSQIFKVFRFLSALSATGGTDLEAGLKTFVRQYRRRGLAVLLSDLYDPYGFEKGINVLRYNKFEPYVIHLVETEDWLPETLGELSIVDCETGAEREVTLTKRLLAQLRTRSSEYEQGIERFCAKSQVPYLRADSRAPFDEVVFGLFRLGGFLR